MQKETSARLHAASMQEEPHFRGSYSVPCAADGKQAHTALRALYSHDAVFTALCSGSPDLARSNQDTRTWPPPRLLELACKGRKVSAASLNAFRNVAGARHLMLEC